jgi:hypothetical protein
LFDEQEYGIAVPYRWQDIARRSERKGFW